MSNEELMQKAAGLLRPVVEDAARKGARDLTREMKRI